MRRAPWQAVALEVTASVLAFGAVVMFPLHYLAARLAFLGDQAVVHEREQVVNARVFYRVGSSAREADPRGHVVRVEHLHAAHHASQLSL